MSGDGGESGIGVFLRQCPQKTGSRLVAGQRTHRAEESFGGLGVGGRPRRDGIAHHLFPIFEAPLERGLGVEFQPAAEDTADKKFLGGIRRKVARTVQHPLEIARFEGRGEIHRCPALSGRAARPHDRGDPLARLSGEARNWTGGRGKRLPPRGSAGFCGGGHRLPGGPPTRQGTEATEADHGGKNGGVGH